MAKTETQQQIKVLVPSEIAVAFKQACTSSQVSMAMLLTQFMAEYSNNPLQPKTVDTPDYSSRRRRRAALKGIVKTLMRIKEGEERSRDNTPDNLQASAAWEKADEIISLLEEAIESLETAMVP